MPAVIPATEPTYKPAKGPKKMKAPYVSTPPVEKPPTPVTMVAPTKPDVTHPYEVEMAPSEEEEEGAPPAAATGIVGGAPAEAAPMGPEIGPEVGRGEFYAQPEIPGGNWPIYVGIGMGVGAVGLLITAMILGRKKGQK
jgi:hypothetical protein